MVFAEIAALEKDVQRFTALQQAMDRAIEDIKNSPQNQKAIANHEALSVLFNATEQRNQDIHSKGQTLLEKVSTLKLEIEAQEG